MLKHAGGNAAVCFSALRLRPQQLNRLNIIGAIELAELTTKSKPSSCYVRFQQALGCR